jgi:hypothetical protein
LRAKRSNPEGSKTKELDCFVAPLLALTAVRLGNESPQLGRFRQVSFAIASRPTCRCTIFRNKSTAMLRAQLRAKAS